MKSLSKFAPVALLGALCLPAMAEPSVTLYGLLSAGLGYTTHQGSGKTWDILSGTNQNPRWGLKGQEDLGGGLSSIFQLENGFNLTTGSLSQNGRIFGRQAWVGLRDRTYGTLTLGRQYDAMHDYIGPIIIASNGVNIGDNDNGYNDIRVQNSVKYVTPDMQGLRATAVYGFSDTSDMSDNNAYSFGVGYTDGPLRWSAVWERFNNPYSSTNSTGAIANDYASSLLLFTKSENGSYAKRQTTAGTGGFYTIGRAQWAALVTDVRYDYLDGTTLNMQNYGVNLVFAYTPKLNLGVAYGFTMGKYTVTNNHPKWHQVNLQADYYFSKHTDVAITLIDQEAAGDAAHAQIFGFEQAEGKSQTMVTLGMRHTF